MSEKRYPSLLANEPTLVPHGIIEDEQIKLSHSPPPLTPDDFRESPTSPSTSLTHESYQKYRIANSGVLSRELGSKSGRTDESALIPTSPVIVDGDDAHCQGKDVCYLSQDVASRIEPVRNSEKDLLIAGPHWQPAIMKKLGRKVEKTEDENENSPQCIHYWGTPWCTVDHSKSKRVYCPFPTCEYHEGELVILRVDLDEHLRLHHPGEPNPIRS